jgi:hypothetical protein
MYLAALRGLAESVDGGGAMTRLPTLVLVLLGYLVGCAEAMNGEAAGRVSLECVGLIVTAFLFYLAFSSAATALFSGKWRRKRPSVKPRGLSEVASAAAKLDAKSPATLKKARP